MSNLQFLDDATKLAISTFLQTERNLSKPQKNVTISKKTRGEYIQLAKALMRKRASENKSIEAVINETKYKNTFYKRVSAMKLYISQIGIRSINILIKQDDIASSHNIKTDSIDLIELENVINNGFSKEGRMKRKSKRSALKGLPSDWRERVCNFNMNSKYRIPMLVLALTGCRPSELEKGIRVNLKKPESLQGFIVGFDIGGVKLSAEKGQEIRRITYTSDDKNILLSEFLGSVNLFEYSSFDVGVKSAANFSKEITRIGGLIWPAHKETVSAYCFRHQFASDLKKHYCGNDVSLALGHASAKTRKTYGSASQSRGQPPQLSVGASREIKDTVSNKKNTESNER